MPPTTLQIAGRTVGPGMPAFVIAEAGVNHNGQMPLALALVDAAARAGADAVKFQAFCADRLATAEAPKASYQKTGSKDTQSQREMLARLELSADDLGRIAEHCRERRILFLSSAFDEQSADELDRIGVPAFKIPSGEVTNLTFLAHVARKGKPLIVSTGMSYLSEVDEAVRTIRSASDAPMVLLYCVSNYPAEPRDVDLRAMHTLEAAFGTPVGYSDHTLGMEVPLAAVALGACLIEKHFTLDRTLPGPDHQASADPAELASLVAGIRSVEATLGDGRMAPSLAELETSAVVRKSLAAIRNVASGTVLTADMIALRRPGTGLPPSAQRYVVGRMAKVEIPAGTLLTLEMLA